MPVPSCCLRLRVNNNMGAERWLWVLNYMYRGTTTRFHWSQAGPHRLGHNYTRLKHTAATQRALLRVSKGLRLDQTDPFATPGSFKLLLIPTALHMMLSHAPRLSGAVAVLVCICTQTSTFPVPDTHSTERRLPGDTLLTSTSGTNLYGNTEAGTHILGPEIYSASPGLPGWVWKLVFFKVVLSH